jgi:hypothetical protein
MSEDHKDLGDKAEDADKAVELRKSLPKSPKKKQMNFADDAKKNGPHLSRPKKLYGGWW